MYISYQANEVFGRKMNHEVNGNRKLFWKEVSYANGRKMKGWSIIEDGNGRLALGEAEVRRIRKKYFEDLYNINTKTYIAVHMCGLDGVQRGNYFGGEPIKKAEVEVKVGKLKNGKASGKDEVTGEMIEGRGDKVVNFIWKLCNISFAVLEEWMSAVIVPLYKAKGKRNECRN